MIPLEEALAVVDAQLELVNKTHAGFSHDHELFTRWSARRREVLLEARQRLEALGARVRDNGHQTTVRLAGISASSTMGLESALRNWREGAARKITATMEAGNGVD